MFMLNDLLLVARVKNTQASLIDSVPFSRCTIRPTTDKGTNDFLSFFFFCYLLFSHTPANGRYYSGQVHHTPYQYRQVEVAEWSALPALWDGLPLLEGPPAHACVAEPVDVEVFALREITAT